MRRDLADAVKSAMSNLIINGVAPTNANPQHVEGFLAKLTGVDLSSAEADATDYGRLHSLGVDGIHAEMETQVSSVIGDETYQHAAGVYIAGSGESGSELLRRRSGGCYASTYIPAASGMKQAAILHAAGANGGTMRDDSVAGDVADLGNYPGYLFAGEPRRHFDLDIAMGRAHCAPRGRVQATRYPDHIETTGGATVPTFRGWAIAVAPPDRVAGRVSVPGRRRPFNRKDSRMNGLRYGALQQGAPAKTASETVAPQGVVS